MSDKHQELEAAKPRSAQPTIAERRDFLARSASMLGVALCGGALASLVGACEDDETRNPVDPNGGGTGGGGKVQATLDLSESNNAALTVVGGSLLRSFGSQNGGEPLILAHTEQNVFHAYTSVCTHQGCSVEAALDNGRIWCACHDSYFDPGSGDVLDGPATLPLMRFPVEFDESTQILTITF